MIRNSSVSTVSRLHDERAGVRILAVPKKLFSARKFQTGDGTHPGTHPMGNGNSLPGVKRSGSEVILLHLMPSLRVSGVLPLHPLHVCKEQHLFSFWYSKEHSFFFGVWVRECECACVCVCVSVCVCVRCLEFRCHPFSGAAIQQHIPVATTHALWPQLAANRAAFVH
jgi:hypothetical protein